MNKPNPPPCFSCGRKFRGSHFTPVSTVNGLVYAHKQCAESMVKDGAGKVVGE